MDLESLVGDLYADFGSVVLGNGSDLGDILTAVKGGGCLVDQGAGCLDLGCHVSHIPLQALVAGDGLLELLAGLGVIDGKLQSLFRNAQSLGGHADSAAVQGLHEIVKASAGFAYSIGYRYSAVLKEKLADIRRADTHLLLTSAQGEAGSIAVDNDRGEALHTCGRICDRKDGDEIAFFGSHVGDETLAAVDDILVAVDDSGCLDIGGIGTCGGLSQGKRADSACGSLGEVFLLEFLRAVLEDRHVSHVLDGDQLSCGGILSGQLLDHDGLLHHAQTQSAVFLRNADTHQAHLAHHLDDIGIKLLFLIHSGRAGLQLIFCKISYQLTNAFLLVSINKSHCKTFL